jgi:tetratricopeptide (TPR) repeat protein
MQARYGFRPGLAAAVALTWGASLSAGDLEARTIESSEQTQTLVGSYLAGRFASSQHEADQAASFYGTALSRDPDNEVLLERAFLMELSNGDWKRTLELAEMLIAKQPTNRMARLALGLSDFKAGNLTKADDHFKAASNSPIGELTSALVRAWLKLAEGKSQAALAMLEVPKQAEWAQYYLRYHKALIADIAGDRKEARRAYERVFKQDSRTLRTTLAYARHAAHSGEVKLAQSILKENLDKSQGEGHALVRALVQELDRDDTKTSLLVSTPTQGMAEVFYGLGEALTGEGGVSIGVPYLQMALYLEQRQPFALAALANAHETTKRYEEAIAVYDLIPKATPLATAIEIRKAFNLNSLDKVDEARALLEQVARRDPDDLKPLDALAGILRSRKSYDEAIVYYSKAIDLIDKPQKRHWSYFYSRGTCYERIKKWPQAEADLKKALQLMPDQPLVLNYLGYSWIDQGRNLKEGMQLIEKAVALKPDDGYIVDSLGWAHYRLGRYKEAVRYLERAVELRPEDPVLNDHLGDALWRVGREREARFQWDQALSLKPEPEDVEKIQAKLANGLPTQRDAAQARKAKNAQRPKPSKRIETKLAPQPALPSLQ